VARDRPFDVVVDYAHSPDGFRQGPAHRSSDPRRPVRRRPPARGRGHRRRPRPGRAAPRWPRFCARSPTTWCSPRPTCEGSGRSRSSRTCSAERGRSPAAPCGRVLDRRVGDRGDPRRRGSGRHRLVLGRGALTRQMNDRSGTWHDFDDRAVVRTWLAEQCPAAGSLEALPAWALELLETERVGHLGLLDDDGHPAGPAGDLRPLRRRPVERGGRQAQAGRRRAPGPAALAAGAAGLGADNRPLRRRLDAPGLAPGHRSDHDPRGSRTTGRRSRRWRRATRNTASKRRVGRCSAWRPNGSSTGGRPPRPDRNPWRGFRVGTG